MGIFWLLEARICAASSPDCSGLVETLFFNYLGERHETQVCAHHASKLNQRFALSDQRGRFRIKEYSHFRPPVPMRPYREHHPHRHRRRHYAGDDLSERDDYWRFRRQSATLVRIALPHRSAATPGASSEAPVPCLNG